MQFRKINAIHATILAFLLAFTSSLILEKGFLDQKALLFNKYDLYICAVSISIDALFCSFFSFQTFGGILLTFIHTVAVGARVGLSWPTMPCYSLSTSPYMIISCRPNLQICMSKEYGQLFLAACLKTALSVILRELLVDWCWLKRLLVKKTN